MLSSEIQTFVRKGSSSVKSICPVWVFCKVMYTFSRKCYKYLSRLICAYNALTTVLSRSRCTVLFLKVASCVRLPQRIERCLRSVLQEEPNTFLIFFFLIRFVLISIHFQASCELIVEDDTLRAPLILYKSSNILKSECKVTSSNSQL